MKNLNKVLAVLTLVISFMFAANNVQAELKPNDEIYPEKATSVIAKGAIPDDEGFFNAYQITGNGPAPFTPVLPAETADGKIQFVNHPLSFANMTFGDEVYPLGMCGLAVISNWAEGQDSAPMPVCLARTKDDKFALIELVEAKWLPELEQAKRNGDENVAGRRFADVSFKDLKYRVACDAYANFEYNDCVAVTSDFERIPKAD